jgi:hypothetical protein
LAIGARCSGVPLVLAHNKEDEPLCKALGDTEINYSINLAVLSGNGITENKTEEDKILN